jgi:hypothetical protein
MVLEGCFYRALLSFSLRDDSKKRRAKSASRCPCYHLSAQNRVPTSFPTSVIVATAKNARTWSGTCTSKVAQGRCDSVFLNQSQWVLRAQPNILRLRYQGLPSQLAGIPYPRQQGNDHLLLPCDLSRNNIFVNCFMYPCRKIQSHCQINDCWCSHKLEALLGHTQLLHPRV